jgi:hypothetical protein
MSPSAETSPSHPTNRTLGVIILGASVYPRFPSARHLDNDSFARSAAAFVNLFQDEKAIVFPRPVILDLFDSDDDPSSLVERIRQFIRNEQKLTDVLFYYCGHGEFLPDRRYYLTLKRTTPENEAFTGLPLRQMGITLEAPLASKRVFIVLDCCFAGRAAKELMTTALGNLIEKDVLRPFPRRGRALIAASAAGEPAIAPEGEPLTMFTGALVDVVSNGIAGEKRELSLRDIVDSVRIRINERHGSAGVAPQIHAPWQIEGDITELPFFVNRAFVPPPETTTERETYQATVADLERPLARTRRAAVETLEQLLSNTQSDAFRIEILDKLTSVKEQDDSYSVRKKCEEILHHWPERPHVGKAEAVGASEMEPLRVEPQSEMPVGSSESGGEKEMGRPKGPTPPLLSGMTSGVAIAITSLVTLAFLYFYRPGNVEQSTEGPQSETRTQVPGGSAETPETTAPPLEATAPTPRESASTPKATSSLPESSVTFPETSATTTSSWNVKYHNRDLPGGDLSRSKKATLDDCVSACQDNSACMAYTFDRWNNYCFLKSQVGELTINPRSVSGVRSDPPPRENTIAPIRMERYRGKIFPGEGDRSFLAKSVEGCEQPCKQDNSCVAYTFTRATKQCRLFSSTGEYFPDRSHDSGTKIQSR